MDPFIFVKIFFLTVLSFMVALLSTPLLTHFMYKYKWGKNIRTAEGGAPIMSQMHAHKAGTPTMGGILIWITTLALAMFFYALAIWTNWEIFDKLNFLTRSETYLPLGALVASALVGVIDDILNIKGIGSKGGGLKIRYKLLIYTVIALVAAFWFYFKLDWDVIGIPFINNFEIGWWIIPVFVFVIVGTSFSVNEIDGLDGLAGGTLAAAFAAFGIIAFTQSNYDLATFCGVIVGALLAFLWFNITPARFFMGDTGSMSLGVTLGIIAMLTNSVLILPVIGFLFVVEALSVIIQLTSKKFFKRKVFISAPIHHHLEAQGWSEPKIVMRFWLIAMVMAVIGVVISLMDKIY